MFAIAVTKYLLNILFGVSGAFTSEKIIKMPVVKIAFIEKVPVLRALSGLSIIFWVAILAAVVLGFVINKTPWGLHIRATGLNDTAVNTAGVNPHKIRYMCITLSGVFCGFAGAYLSTSYLAMFTNGMTAGRGYLGNIASILGNRTAGGTFLGALLFSVIDGITMRIQTFGFPSQLIQLIPYIVAVMVVIITAVLKQRRKKTKRA